MTRGYLWKCGFSAFPPILKIPFPDNSLLFPVPFSHVTNDRSYESHGSPGIQENAYRNNAQFPKIFPVFSLHNREFCGDKFAADCVHHHSPWAF